MHVGNKAGTLDKEGQSETETDQTHNIHTDNDDGRQT